MIKINDIVLFSGFSCVVESLTDDSAVVRARGFSSRVWSVPVTDLELHPLAVERAKEREENTDFSMLTDEEMAGEW